MSEHKPNLVFLIEKLWIDEMDTNNNVGYSPFGFVYDEETAKDICKKGKTYTPKDSWAITYPMPEFRYKPLSSMENIDKIELEKYH